MKLLLEDVLAARSRIKRYIHQTPLLTSSRLSAIAGCQVHFKAEHLQKTGSFKARGALNFLLDEANAAEVYTTYSSGNHGQALTWACGLMEKKAVIFMPEDASPVKVAAIAGYGGEVRYAGLSSIDRQEACLAYAAESGACVVPPFDHERIIAGQGSVMLEVLEALPMFDAALIQTGGGGLLAGNALVLTTLRRQTPVYACEPELAADVAAGLAAGERQSIDYPDTIADGLRNLRVGDRNWAIIGERVTSGLTCSEARIREAMGLLSTYLKQVVEPSGATAFACLLANKELFAGKRVVVYLSGGNIALPDFGRLITDHGR